MLFIALHSHLSRILYITQKVCCSKSWSNCINITELVPKWSRVLSHPIALLVLFQSGTEGENLNMTGVQQTQIVFNNISIISSKFFFLALHICQRQSLSKFFLKIHRVSKVRFMRFYYLKTDFIRILLIKPHKSNF